MIFKNLINLYFVKKPNKCKMYYKFYNIVNSNYPQSELN